MKFVLEGLYCGPLLTLIPPLTRTSAKNRGSGNRVSDFRVSGGPPVCIILYPQDRFYTTYSSLSETLVFFLVLYGLAILVSIYGNILVLWIVKTTTALRNTNNLLVSNLAITDIIIATICTPFHFHAALVQRWDLPEFMCKVLPFVQNMCVNVQILNLILIAKDRYVLYRIFNKCR